MTKREIIEELTVRYPNFTSREATTALNVMIEAMTDSLARGQRIEIRGFGSFGVKQRRERQGRNPKTGTRVEVPSKRIPYFKPSKELKDLVNNSSGDGAQPAPAGAAEQHPGGGTPRTN